VPASTLASALVPTADRIHDYRLEIRSDGVATVFYDGDFAVAGASIAENTPAEQRISFGEGTYLAYGESAWSYVRHNAGAAECSGTVQGTVTASCTDGTYAAYGVTLDAFDVATGALVANAITAEDGAYVFEDLPAGSYTITVVAPLGQDVDQNDAAVAISGGTSTQVDFTLSCAPAIGERRGSGFWKHEFGVATGGSGKAEIEPATLCSYLDLIEARFNSNTINQVIVYEPPASGTCEDKLQAAAALLNLKGRQEMIARARQKFLSLLLDVAAGSIVLHAPASTDGATTSQAVTFVDRLLDDPAGDNELAKDVVETLLRGDLVATGVIPVDTENIAYKTAPDVARPNFGLVGARPNPFNPRSTIEFALAKPGAAYLRIYDLAGRLVREFDLGERSAGVGTVQWLGDDQQGQSVSSGVYIVRLVSEAAFDVMRITLLK
jgi:hypothetical protein